MSSVLRRLLPVLGLCFFLPFALPAQSASNASAAVARSPVPGQKLHIPGVPNGGKISDVFYRGAQPKEQGLSELKKLGIQTIVDLRAEDPSRVAWESRRSESLGMRFVHIPVNAWSPPTGEQVAEFLSIVHGDPRQKIFVHCHFGEDRTGVFVAAYRIALDQWSSEQAVKEMYFFGFHGFWHPSMKSFVLQFPAHLNSAPAFASFRSPALQP